MIKPRNNYVLVELPAKMEEQKTKGGLILPTMATTVGPGVQGHGVIKALGPDCKELKIKMTVMYPVHAGLKHMEQGKEYVILMEHEVMAIVEKE